MGKGWLHVFVKITQKFIFEIVMRREVDVLCVFYFSYFSSFVFALCGIVI